ncbi:MAG TPA: HU family DNA-binding protein [Firmicutes bacterium]|nr:HU family DNA-binding protein [Candidatus Fermentithermobacillaceae bacterium]
MNKSELVGRVAEVAGLTKKDTEKVINAFVDVVQEALAKGESVGILGFGTFLVRDRAAREGMNPRTRQPIQIPATKVPVFRPGRNLRLAVGGGETGEDDEQ